MKNLNQKEEEENFSFTRDNQAKLAEIIARYPAGRQQSAVMPALWLVQEQTGGWIPDAALESVGEALSMPAIRVREVASFYGMFKTEPIGRYLLQICTTTPCGLCGAEDLVKICREKLGINFGETTSDGVFTLEEVECLGSCIGGPVVQINKDYHENLTPEIFSRLLDELRENALKNKGERGASKLDSEPHISPTVQDLQGPDRRI